MTENEQRPEDPPSYPKNGTYADLLIWHLKIWWTRPDGSPKSRGTKPWTTSELLSKVFGPNRVDIDNQNNLFKNWTGFKKKERSGSENGRKISHAIFGGQPQFLIWANDLENARVRTNGAGKNRLTISIERCLADLVANASTYFTALFECRMLNTESFFSTGNSSASPEVDDCCCCTRK